MSLARSISDAVIIGSNSLLLENNSYAATIDIAELIDFRQQLNKPAQILHVVICRDANKINWHEQTIVTNQQIKLIIFTLQTPQNLPNNIILTEDFNPNITKQIIRLDTLDIQLIIKILSTNGIASILNESPYYHHQLLEHQLLDELWLNTSTVHIGGAVSSLGQQCKSFTSYNHPHLTILSLHHIGYNFLYTRYKVDYAIN